MSASAPASQFFLKQLTNACKLDSMASGPERPDAARGDQRSPDAMGLKLGGIRVIRFPGEQCGHHRGWEFRRNALSSA